MSDEFKKAALDYHARPVPGKLSVELTKPAQSVGDLALAYSPGVAEPAREISRDPAQVYRYTGKGNLVAVVTNGSSVLDLGSIGPLASKPVMEGKALLFKRLAGINAIDIEVDAESPQAFIDTVARIAETFGGINLEDIKAPECFEIERSLAERCCLPVFHNDQHGTAIVMVAGLLNALAVAGKSIDEARIVCLGAGSGANASMRLLIACGARLQNLLLLDRKGVIHSGRTDVGPDKASFAVETDKRTLAQALDGADVFVGLAGPELLAPTLLRRMAERPILFACASPEPEIRPEQALAQRQDLIIATGRPEYANQINNLLCYPYLFRGALDVRATTINEAMKTAAIHAIAGLAREPVPDEVLAAYGLDSLEFGPDYLLPKPIDPRLLAVVSAAVARAAVESGVARLPYPAHYPLQAP